jgi:hypothetical protein
MIGQLVQPAARHCALAFEQASPTLIWLMPSKPSPVAVHCRSHSQSCNRGEALGSAGDAGPGTGSRAGAAREDATVHPTVVSAKIMDTQIPNLFMGRPFPVAIDLLGSEPERATQGAFPWQAATFLHVYAKLLTGSRHFHRVVAW